MDIDEEGEDGDVVMGDGEDDDDEDDDDDLDIEEDDDDNEEVDEELRRKIQAVLQKKDPNNIDGTLEEDDEEELPDLNDDEMLDFDEKLAEIFKQRKIIKTSRRGKKNKIK